MPVPSLASVQSTCWLRCAKWEVHAARSASLTMSERLSTSTLGFVPAHVGRAGWQVESGILPCKSMVTYFRQN